MKKLLLICLILAIAFTAVESRKRRRRRNRRRADAVCDAEGKTSKADDAAAEFKTKAECLEPNVWVDEKDEADAVVADKGICCGKGSGQKKHRKSSLAKKRAVVAACSTIDDEGAIAIVEAESDEDKKIALENSCADGTGVLHKKGNAVCCQEKEKAKQEVAQKRRRRRRRAYRLK